MGTEQRRARERTQRRAAILDAARELAEADGWDAVTTRRLAERIEYSQPVLYSHFAGKDAIVAAVAVEGFVDLATALRRADDLEAVARTYLAFARDRPATYTAMFTLPTDLRFAADDTPAELQDAFAALREPLAAATGDDALELRTELLWSTLHGLATLTAGGRIPTAGTDELVSLLVGSAMTSGGIADTTPTR